MEVKNYFCYGKGVQKSVLCREVVPFLEGPLSEFLLYQYNKVKVVEKVLKSQFYLL